MEHKKSEMTQPQQQQGAIKNIQGQLFNEFGEVPLTETPTPTEVNIPISEDDSKNIEIVIADVEVKTLKIQPRP